MLFVLKQYHTVVLIEDVILIGEILYAIFTHHHFAIVWVSFRGGGHVHAAHFKYFTSAHIRLQYKNQH